MPAGDGETETAVEDVGAEELNGDMILLIDNYDSFTYNLVQRLGEIDPSLDLEVHRNDQITLDEIEARQPSHLIISPGPCTPDEAGISVACVKRFAGQDSAAGRLPGAPVDRPGLRRQDRPRRPPHARQDRHDPPRATATLRGLPNPFKATRYHSLVIQPDTLAERVRRDRLEQRARRRAGDHGHRHKTLPLFGVQFHPESFLTDCGTRILENFLKR